MVLQDGKNSLVSLTGYAMSDISRGERRMSGFVGKLLNKELASVMCMFHNAHIDYFREGVRSSRNVQ